MRIRTLLAVALMGVSAFVNAQESEAIYGIKSGVVTTQMDMMGQSMTQVLYFDDYGRKQATSMDFGDMKIRMLNVNGDQIMYNENQNVAMRMGRQQWGNPGPGIGGRGNAASQINWNNLTDETIKTYNIKKVGKEKVLGRSCTRYSYEIDLMGQMQKTVVSVYKGIVLKIIFESENGTWEQNVAVLEENVQIPSTVFILPESVVVQDMNGAAFDLRQRSNMPRGPQPGPRPQGPRGPMGGPRAPMGAPGMR